MRQRRKADSSFVNTVNPFSKTHGAPTDSERHVGDLGNFKTDKQGNAEGTITDEQIKLIGPTSVLGVCILLSLFRRISLPSMPLKDRSKRSR